MAYGRLSDKAPTLFTVSLQQDYFFFLVEVWMRMKLAERMAVTKPGAMI